LQVDIWRDGRHWRQRFARGAVASELVDLGPTDRRGTRVHFLPDASIFDRDARLAFEGLSRRTRELSYLLPGVELVVRDEREGHHRVHRHEGGLASFVASLNDTRVPIHPQPIVIDGEHRGVRVQAALQWTSLYAEDTRSFANTIATPDGGTHVAGLRSGIAAVVKRLDREVPRRPGSKELKLRASDTREGLTGVLSVMLQDPRFMGQTKTRLADAMAEEAVRVVVEQQLEAALREDSGIARVIVEKARSAALARASARRARERIQHSHRHQDIDEEAYKTQFGIRSKNWHQSAEWIANDGLLAAHAAMCKVPPTAHLLDVCCGSGVVGHAFKDRVASTTGLDITPEMVGLSRERLDKVVQGTVFDLPFADDSYDIVVNREVMHLFPRPQDMLREVYRVLKPGGQFIFGQIVPFAAEDAAWMYRIFIKKQPLLHHMFMAEDLVELLRSIGFDGIETAEHLLWESIDVWIDTWETTRLHRHEIRELYYNAPAEVRAVHPFEITPDGHIRDLWRWVIFSCWKPPVPDGVLPPATTTGESNADG
ncbi:MAG: methyltransferase domain-containing protein, partial [Deltaproteobacteria bacterium]